MTTKNRPEDSKSNQPGKEQRPHATLELTAKEVSGDAEGAGAKPSGKPALEHKPAEDPGTRGTSGGNPAFESCPPPPREVTGASLASHLSAGALGAVLALIFGYSVFWNDDASEQAEQAARELTALRGQFEATQTRLAGLEESIKKAATDTQSVQKAQGDTLRLEEQLKELASRVETVESQPIPAGSNTQDVQQSLEPLSGRLAKLEEQLADVAKAQSETQTDGRGSALALAWYNLRRAADAGKPFRAELKSVREMSPVPLELAELEKLGGEGIENYEALKAGLAKQSNAAIDAEDEKAGGSVASNVWSRMSSLVQVRRKGNVDGDDARAILARVEYQLDQGNLSAALSEVEKLPVEAKKAMGPWAEALKARITADNALREIEAQLLTALGRDESVKRGG